MDICGDQAIFMPEDGTCDECAVFEERLSRVEKIAKVYAPGDNVWFDLQPDGSITINATGGGGGGGGGGGDCQTNTITWDDATNSLRMVNDKDSTVQTQPLNFKHLRIESGNSYFEVDADTPSVSMSDDIKTALLAALGL